MTDHVDGSRPSVSQDMHQSTTKPSPVPGDEVDSPNSRTCGLMEASFDPLIALTTEGLIIDLNEAAVQMTGATREQLLGGDFTDYVAQMDQIRSLFREVLSKGSVTDCSLAIRHRTGKIADLTCKAIAARNAEGDVTEIFLSARDVTAQKSTDAVLRQGEQKFIEAQRLAHIGYWEQDVDAGNPAWSQEACRIFGLPSQEHGVTWDQLAALIHPDDRVKAMRAIHEALQGGLRYDIEFRVVLADGEERVVHSQSDVTLDSAGHPIRMFGTFQDITERRRNEEELRQTNARISEILESITDRFAVVDRNWRYVYVNERQAWSRCLSREEMMGRRIWSIYPELAGTPAEEKLKQAMADRVPVKFDLFLPSQNRWLGVHVYPSKEGVAIYSRDISESKQAEERLRNSEERYRALYRDNPVMLFTLDPQGTILDVNPSAVNQLGYSADELEGKSVLKVFHPDDREDVARQLHTCLANPSHVQHWRYRKIQKDGGILWVEEMVRPIRDLNGAVNVLVVCQDITKRKRAEEKVSTLNASLERRVQNRTRELAESEKRFRNIYDTAPVSIWQEDWTEVIASMDVLRAEGVTDFDAHFRDHPDFVERALRAVKILDVNQWTVGMFGAETREEILTSLGAVFATPDTLPGFVGELVALAKGELTYRTEMALNTVKGDTILCFLAMTFPPPGSGGGNVLVSVVDITERKRTEEALRRSEEYARLLFDTTLQGVVFQEADGRVISMNASAIRILGKTPEEMSSGAASLDMSQDVLREDGSSFPLEERPAMVAMATGREVRNVIMGVYNPREGVYRWIDVRAVPLFRAGTNIPHQVYSIFDDITERVRSERHIRRQTALLTGINRIFRETLPHVTDEEVAAIFLEVIRDLTASPIGFVDEAPAEGNRTHITLDTSLQMRGDLSRENTLASLQRPEAAALRDAWVTGRSEIMNQPPADHPDFRAITRFLGVPLLESGKVIGLIGLANKPSDYTDADRRAVEAIVPAFVEVLKRKRSEQAVLDLNDQLAGRALALERANKELESFSYSASHDLRAPLRSLEGFTRALTEDYEDRLDDVGRDYLHRIRRASERMGHLIDDMLHLAQVSRAGLHRTSVNLSALARGVAEGLRATDPKRQVEFVIESKLTASGDAHLLQIVMENLFGNAWKFSESRPVAKIEFGRTTRDGQPAYFVRDNGVGFDMRFAHKLFGAFQRLHTVSEFPGTGIGLATVQRVIHRHGGSVSAEGRPGHGATFYFTLPD